MHIIRSIVQWWRDIRTPHWARELRETIMAIGAETKAALEELQAAVSAEAEQAAGGDAATAAAIRAQVQSVRDIIADVPVDPETGL